MELVNINLDLKNDTKEKEKQARIKAAEEKRRLKEYQPSMMEIWYTGYTTSTGRHKPGIFQTKVSENDRRKLEQVYQAISDGELSIGVEDNKKFTKTHALKLYAELLKVRRISIIKKMIETKPDNYHLVTTIKQLQKLCEMLERVEVAEGFVALDTETDGLNIFGVGEVTGSRIVGLVFTIPSYSQHFYIPFGHLTGETQLSEAVVMSALKHFIETPKIKKVLHNAKYDIHMLRNHGINLGGFHFDTMVAMHLLNENEMSYALKNLANKYGRFFGYEDSSSTYEELFGKGGFENTPLDIGHIYACKDGHLTWLFYEFIMEQFERLPELKKYYYEIEQPITLVSVEMEKNGFLIDLEMASKYAKELEGELSNLETELKHYFGDINFNSPKQLSEFLYDVMELRDVSKKRSTDANTLKALSRDFKGCKVLLEYRDLNKLLSTYIVPLPAKIGRDGRLHGQFKQSGTVTGRFASSEPNLQNLPKNARTIIKAADGKVILGIDFSQIEPRVLAYMSGDETFKIPYKTGQDLYSSIASQVFKKPIEECGDGSIYRKQSKIILLGVMYGMSAKSLADMLGIPVFEAEKFIEDFFNSYEGVAQFVKDQNVFADDNGYVQTLLGRKRRFMGHKEVAANYHRVAKIIKQKYGMVPKNIWASDIDYGDKQKLWAVSGKYQAVARQSVNAVIQGTAAEVMKKAMILLWKYCIKKGYKMLATVHDEVLIEVPENIEMEEIEMLENLMCTAVSLGDVPVKVDTEIMKVWGKGISKAEWKDNGYKVA